MEKIGEKINRIRKEMGLSQENIHHQQSLVSQIESGSISKPGEGVLHEIAQNLGTTFLSLVDDTDWKAEPTIKSKEVAFSPVIVDVEIDDNGNISWENKPYPLFNEKGEKNKYCPESGRKLIDQCGECERQVESVKQKHCFGCGKALFIPLTIPLSLTEYFDDKNVFIDYNLCNHSIQVLSAEIAEYRGKLEDIERLPKVVDVDLKKELHARLTRLLPEAIVIKIKDSITENKEIPKEVSDQIKFIIQVAEALQKKLRSVITSLGPPQMFDTIDQMKTELFRDIAANISIILQRQLGGDTSRTPELGNLLKMLKEVETTKDSEDLIKLQSRIDHDIKTEDDSDDEKISEGGNSETAAAEKAERNNKNAKIVNKEKED
jgi:transcriptional regulator with XRE-family HTH domain